MTLLSFLCLKFVLVILGFYFPFAFVTSLGKQARWIFGGITFNLENFVLVLETGSRVA